MDEMDDSRYLYARTSLEAAFGFLQVEIREPMKLWSAREKGKKKRKEVEGFERQSGRIERLLKINLRSQSGERGGSVRKYNTIYTTSITGTRLPTILQKSQNPKA